MPEVIFMALSVVFLHPLQGNEFWEDIVQQARFVQQFQSNRRFSRSEYLVQFLYNTLVRDDF